MTNRALAFAVLGALLAGCAGSPAPGTADAPVVVTAPDDYSYLNQTDALSRPHLHDYWGGKDRIKVLDQTRQAVMQFGGASNWVRTMQMFPDDGQVIPQGTAYLEVQLEFAPAPGDHVETYGIAWRAANETELGDSHALDDEGRVTIPTNNSSNDLPHQVISNWEFWFAAKSSDYVRFTGSIRFVVDAVRGLPIPLFPSHPDQWNGTSEIPLLDRDDELYDVYTEVPTPMCMPVPGLDRGPELCPHDVSPEAGRIVPADASHVEVTIQTTTPTIGLILYYHGGDTRQYTEIEPTETAGDLRTYRIFLNGNGDGPYAESSMWRFLVRGDVVPESAVEAGSYHITATAFQSAPVGHPPSSTERSTFESAASSSHREIVLVAGQSYDYSVRATGNELKVRIELSNGVSRDAVLTGPGLCKKATSVTSVVGASTGGNSILRASCGPVNGTVNLHLDAGLSTFRGQMYLTGATFA